MKRQTRHLKAHWRLFHRHHGHALKRAGHAGVFGELAYHSAEIAGAHQYIATLAGLLVVCTLARIASGELHG
jgi:hypothetical protein